MHYISFVSEDPDLSHLLSSTTGKSLYYVFGMTTDVKEFDKHHTSFKRFKWQSSLAKCQTLRKKFKLALPSAKEKSESQFREWERRFLAENNRLPLSSDLDAHNKKLKKTFQYATSLMKHWGS